MRKIRKFLLATLTVLCALFLLAGCGDLFGSIIGGSSVPEQSSSAMPDDSSSGKSDDSSSGTPDKPDPEKPDPEKTVRLTVRRIDAMGAVVETTVTANVGQTLREALPDYDLSDASVIKIDGQTVTADYVIKNSVTVEIESLIVPPSPMQVSLSVTVFHSNGKTEEYTVIANEGETLATALINGGISGDIVKTFDIAISGKDIDPDTYVLTSASDGIKVELLDTRPPKAEITVSVDVFDPEGVNISETMIYNFDFVIPVEEQDGLTVGTIVEKYLSTYPNVGEYHLSREFVEQYCRITHFNKDVTLDSAINASVVLEFHIKEGAPKVDDGEVTEYVLTVVGSDGNVLETYTFGAQSQMTVEGILMQNGWFEKYGENGKKYLINSEYLYEYPTADMQITAIRISSDVMAEIYGTDGSVQTFSQEVDGSITVGVLLGYLPIVNEAHDYTVSCSCGALNNVSMEEAAEHIVNISDNVSFHHKDHKETGVYVITVVDEYGNIITEYRVEHSESPESVSFHMIMGGWDRGFGDKYTFDQTKYADVLVTENITVTVTTKGGEEVPPTEYMLTVKSDLGETLAVYPFTQTGIILSAYDIMWGNGWFEQFGNDYSVSSEWQIVYPTEDIEVLVTYMGGVDPVQTYVITVVDEYGNFVTEYRVEHSESPESVYFHMSMGGWDSNFGDQYIFDSDYYSGVLVTESITVTVTTKGGGEVQEGALYLNVFDKNGAQYFDNMSEDYSCKLEYYAPDPSMTYRDVFTSMHETFYLYPRAEYEYAAPTYELNGSFLLENCRFERDGVEVSLDDKAESGTLDVVVLKGGRYEVHFAVIYDVSEGGFPSVKTASSLREQSTTLGAFMEETMGLYQGENEEYSDMYFDSFTWYIGDVVANYETELVGPEFVYGVKKGVTMSEFTVTYGAGEQAQYLSYDRPVGLLELVYTLDLELDDKTLVCNGNTYTFGNLWNDNTILVSDGTVELADQVKYIWGSVLQDDGTLVDAMHAYTGSVTAGEYLSAMELEGYSVLPSSGLEGAYAADEAIEGFVLVVKTEKLQEYTLEITYPKHVLDEYGNVMDYMQYEMATQTLTLARPVWSNDLIELLKNAHELLHKGFLVTLNGEELVPEDTHVPVLIYEGGKATFDHAVYWFYASVIDEEFTTRDYTFVSKTQLTVSEIVAKLGVENVGDYIWEIDGYKMSGDQLYTVTDKFPQSSDYTSGTCSVIVRIATFSIYDMKSDDPEYVGGMSGEYPRSLTISDVLKASGYEEDAVKNVKVYFDYDEYNATTVTDFSVTLASLYQGYSDPYSTPSCHISVNVKRFSVSFNSLSLNDVYATETYFIFQDAITMQHLVDKVNEVNGTDFLFEDFDWRGRFWYGSSEEVQFTSANDIVEESMEFHVMEKYLHIVDIVVDGGETQPSVCYAGAPIAKRLKAFLIRNQTVETIVSMTVYYADGTSVVATDTTSLKGATRVEIVTK